MGTSTMEAPNNFIKLIVTPFKVPYFRPDISTGLKITNQISKIEKSRRDPILAKKRTKINHDLTSIFGLPETGSLSI